MFFKGFNELEGSEASLFFEFFSFSVDFVSSVGDPDKVFLGDGDFFLDVFSVFSSFVSGSFVLIGNVSQVSNVSSVGGFIGGIFFVVFVLGINILLFKGVQ